MKPPFKVGDKVFAKVKGYPPWPALIISQNGKRYNVRFYGTGETGIIKVGDLFYYLKNKEKFQKPLRRKDYVDAFEQIEDAIKVDGGDGDNEQNADLLNADYNASLNFSSSSLNSSTKVTKKTSLKRKRFVDEPSSLNSTIEDNSTEKSDSTDAIIPNKSLKKDLKLKDKEELQDKDSLKKIITTPAPEENKEEQNDNSPEFHDLKIYIISEKTLRNNITYAKHVQDFESTNKDKPVEPREDHINDVLPVKLPTGKIGGIKLHIKWPLKFSNEFSRALYDESTALRVLEEQKKILSGDLTLTNDNEYFISDINMNAEQVKQTICTRDIELKRQKINRLKIEADLSDLDCKIRNCLGLDQANPKEALGYLEEMCEMKFDEIMLKKHPHVVEVVRRLRKYVGNTRKWNMSQESLEEFASQAEKVREKAEDVYCKFKVIVNLPESSTSFWDGFSELVSKFRSKCKDLTQSQIYALCAEPGSRKAFLDQLDEENSEKENFSGIANTDTETNVDTPLETTSQPS